MNNMVVNEILKLRAARAEAEEFISRVDKVIKEIESFDDENGIYRGGRANAAMKRSSLELTMLLADLRRR